MGALSGTPVVIKLDLKTTSYESAAMEFCSSYLPWLVRSFLKRYSVQWLQSRWDEGGGREDALIEVGEKLSCERDFEAHVQHMISFLHARRTDKDVEFLQLQITDAASPP